MSAIERAYLAGFAQAAKEIRLRYTKPNPECFMLWTSSPAFRRGYFAGWDVAK